MALLLGLALLPAWAKSKLEPPELDQYLRWGFLRVRPGFSVSNLGYDDNIFRSREEKVGDYTARLSPRMDGLVLLGDRAFLSFKEQFDYTLYLENNDQNYSNNRASAKFTLPLGDFGFIADLMLNDYRWRPIDQEDVRAKLEENRIGLGLVLLPGWRTEIEIGQSITDFSHFDPDFTSAGQSISERLDRRERASTLELSYHLMGRTNLLLSGLSKDIEFDYDYPSLEEDIDRNTQEWRALGGISLGEGGSLTGSLRIGWARIDARDPAIPDLSEVIGEIELVFRPGSSTKIMLEGERLPGFAVYDVNSYFLHTGAELSIVHYLNSLLGLEVGSGAGRLTFPEGESGTAREDRIRMYEGGIRFRIFENALGRRVEYSLKIGREHRMSNIDYFDRDRTTFYAGAVLGF